MADFSPYPFARLVSRVFRELDEKGSVLDLPKTSFFTGLPGLDLSVPFHGRLVPSPLGPAAGPHTQLAQNIVLSWLAGARVMELKTVQVLDRLNIPRPCIDMRGVGYNVEWSQELRLEQSLEEYVKASMLIDMLIADGRVGIKDRPVFDMSVGYDLAGIQSPQVCAFMHGLIDARASVERLRRMIPDGWRELRSLDFTTAVSDSLTLSTFHGCPPGEIEAMAAFALGRMGLHCTVKLNPTLLGAWEARRLLSQKLGYDDISIPDEAFAKDATWDQVAAFSRRLADKAEGLGRSYGVKFSNTLVVENTDGFLPASEKTKYLSGAPLHVLAIQLVRRWRREFGEDMPVSFSGGIDKRNFPDAVALGLVPVTVCSDLLGPGGYARLRGYYSELSVRMRTAGASSIDSFVEKTGDIEAYADAVIEDPRYSKAGRLPPPRKVGSVLGLFECLTCDKCLSACPNGANFFFDPLVHELPQAVLWREDGRWRSRPTGTLTLNKRHQFANFADFCNECGNCDVFCPEDGGPFRAKPRLYGSYEAWAAAAPGDGFFVETERVRGRVAGKEYGLSAEGDRREYSGPGFRVNFRPGDIEGTAAGEAEGDVDLSIFHIMECLRKALFAKGAINHVNC